MNLKLMRLICLLFVVNLTAQPNASWWFDEANLPGPTRWMTHVSDGTLLTEMDIPGTHDSGALWDPEDPFFADSSKCQYYGIWDQLNMGVRYLDIRCRMINNFFTIHHGAVYQKLNYDDVLTDCRNFLQANPGETILMHVKPEHTMEGCTKTFEEIFADYVRRYPNLFYRPSDNRFPFLGETRGKVVLVRRFGWDQNKTPDIPVFGIDVNAWGDNLPYQYIDTGVRSYGQIENIYIQDIYNHTNSVADKWNYVWSFHKRVVNRHNFPRSLILNYTSGVFKDKSNIFDFNPIIMALKIIRAEVGFVKNMAYYTNGKMMELLNHPMARHHQMGVVICDYIDPNYARAVYKNNFWKNVASDDYNSAVILYKHSPGEDFHETVRVYPNPGMYHAYMLDDLRWLGYENDSMSGISVGPTAPKVFIYDHYNFTGDSMTINPGAYVNLASTFNDRVSSLKFQNIATNPFARTNGESENYADSKLPNLDFKVYPNPSNGIFNIDFASKTDVSKIEVYDEKGSLVLSTDAAVLENTIDITKQPKGMYIVKIYTKHETIVKKIIRS